MQCSWPTDSSDHRFANTIFWLLELFAAKEAQQAMHDSATQQELNVPDSLAISLRQPAGVKRGGNVRLVSTVRYF